MRRPARALLLALLCCARVGFADPEADADRSYRAAEAHAVAGDPRAIDELEALGAVRPITRWTDNAWAEAGKLAERAGDLPRARRDYEHAREVATDPLLVRRVTAALARVAPLVSWTELDAAHDALVGRIQSPFGGDPTLWLCELGVLVDANPRYPRALPAMLELARGWERHGSFALARMWLERAEAQARTPETHEHALAERVRFEMRGGGDIAAGRRALAQIRDPQLRGVLDDELSRSEWRQRLRTVSWILLGLLAACAGFALVRARVGWRALWPPVEVWFVAPIAIVIAGIAATGNPLVSRAVRLIAIAGVAIAWITGALARPRTGWHAALRAALAVLAAAAAVYLAVDRDRMIDIVLETWREGMAGR